jgi:hypothetical protein
VGRLVQRERSAEALSSLTGAEKANEVGVQGVEDCTVACAEVAAAAVEAEPQGPPWLPAAEPKLKHVLETAGL